MKFVHPYLLNLLWALIPLTGIMVYGILKRKKILAGFAKKSMFSLIAPGFDSKRRWIKALLVILGSGFLIVALSGPQFGYRWEKTSQKGVDIMIALDCSRSMLAQDIMPSRLERAKREIIDLLQMMKSDRAGLVAFAGQAILQCPLTLDHEAFNIFLKVLSPGFLPVGGTNLDAAINACFNGFEKESDTKKAIIIITDGESTTGDAKKAAMEMAEKGIKIFTIGVGDKKGAPIPDEKGGFKKDESGNIILAKVDEKGLEKLALVTGGTYVRSVAGDMDLDLIYKDKILGTMERRTLTSGKKKVWENRYQWFLFPGFILLFMEFILSSKKRTQKLFLFIFAFGISLLSIHNEKAFAQTVFSSVKQGIQAFEENKYEPAKKHFIDAQLENPDNATIYYNIGTAAYMNKEYDQAKKNFSQATGSDDPKLRHDAKYNLANTNFKMGNLGEAVKGYENILEEFPEDIQAKENLEFAKQKQQEQKQQDSKSDKDKDDQDKKSDQDNKNQDNKNQDKKKSDKQQPEDKGQPNEQNQPGNKPEPENFSKSQDYQNADPEKQLDKPGGQPRSMENMLNRLEDKPGKAMMPLLQKQYIEKDW